MYDHGLLSIEMNIFKESLPPKRLPCCFRQGQELRLSTRCSHSGLLWSFPIYRSTIKLNEVAEWAFAGLWIVGKRGVRARQEDGVCFCLRKFNSEVFCMIKIWKNPIGCLKMYRWRISKILREFGSSEWNIWSGSGGRECEWADALLVGIDLIFWSIAIIVD